MWNKKVCYLFSLLIVSALATGLSASPKIALASEAGQATVSILPTSITFSPPMAVSNFKELVVRIMGPNDEFVLDERTTGGLITWDTSGHPDGLYRYELLVLTEEINQTTSNDKRAEQATESRLAGRTSGTVEIVNGMFVRQSSSLDKDTNAENWLRLLPIRIVSKFLDVIVPAVHAQSLTASEAVPRVIFNDTTFSGGATETFWIYGSEAGVCATSGSAFFLVEDRLNSNNDMIRMCTSSNSAESITMDISGDIGLANNSVFIDRSSGRVGIGTTTPSAALHILESGEAEVRLDDGGSVVWEVVGGSAGDFDIDIVANSAGRPTGTPISIDDLNGFVGVWNPGIPAAPLEVRSPNANAGKVLVINTTGAGDRVMFELNNNDGAPQYDFIRQAPFVAQWRMEVDAGGQYRFCQGGAPACGLTLNGVNGTFAGTSFAVTHTNTSSRDFKENFKPIDVAKVLDGVAQLPVTEWQFKVDPEERHIGPVAEDFQAVFGLGDGKHISTTDAQGVAFAAIQGLRQENQTLKERIATLEKTVQEFRTLMSSASASDH